MGIEKYTVHHQRSQVTTRLHQLKRIKRAQNKMAAQLSAKRHSDSEFEETDGRLSPPPLPASKKSKLLAALPRLRSPRTIKKECGKQLVKRAMVHAARAASRASNGGVMTRHKRQELEVKQFEQAKAASASGYDSADTVVYRREPAKRSRHETSSETLHSEASSLQRCKKSKKKKKKKSKRRLEEEDDMIYLYMSYSDKPTGETSAECRKPAKDEVETRSLRRSRSASIVTLSSEGTEEKMVTVASKEGSSKSRTRQKSMCYFVILVVQV